MQPTEISCIRRDLSESLALIPEGEMKLPSWIPGGRTSAAIGMGTTAAVSGRAPPPSSSNPPGGSGEHISGNERLR